MARARLLKPGFFSNEALTEIHPFGRLLFAGLWTIADREGRLKDSAKWIKGQLFPYENVPVEKLLGELEGQGFIMRYEVEGERYIQVVNFKKHQHVHKNETESEIPSPFGPTASDTLVRTAPSNGESAPVIYETAPALSTPTSTSTSKAEATSRRERLRGLLTLTPEEWNELIAKYGSSVHARYWEWVDWIGEREGERMPKKGTFVTFRGFLEKGTGRSNTAAAAR